MIRYYPIMMSVVDKNMNVAIALCAIYWGKTNEELYEIIIAALLPMFLSNLAFYDNIDNHPIREKCANEETFIVISEGAKQFGDISLNHTYTRSQQIANAAMSVIIKRNYPDFETMNEETQKEITEKIVDESYEKVVKNIQACIQ